MPSFDEYLNKQQNKTLLKFITCGSVDDGKSTLIGRLLHDSKAIFEDQLNSLAKDSKKSGTTGEKIDFALLVDGLQSEREQGITIDVAYRYFATEKRKYIIADTPGHEQYTRNMVTGASTTDLAVILIDARLGVLTQTRRHSYIVTLLGIRHIVVAINKMDLVGFKEDVFDKIKQDYLDIVPLLPNHEKLTISFVPICAVDGDNVVAKSQNMPWYDDVPLMEYLDGVNLSIDESQIGFRFPVQYVNRPNLNFRGFAGTVASGRVRVGDEIMVLPSKKSSKVKLIVTPSVKPEYTEEAFAPMAITLTLEDEIDISRGDILVSKASLPTVSDSLSAMVVWMSETPMEIGTKYLVKRATTTVFGSVSSIEYKKDINSFDEVCADSLLLNDIAKCTLRLDAKIAFDSYEANRQTGSFIIIDRYSNETVGAGMIIGVGEAMTSQQYSKAEIFLNRLTRKLFPHWEAKDISGEGL